MEKEILAIGGVGLALAAFIKFTVTEKLKKIELISHNQFKVDSLKEQLSEFKKMMEQKLSAAQQLSAERHAEIKMFISENRKMRDDFILVKNETATQWGKIDEISKDISALRNKDL